MLVGIAAAVVVLGVITRSTDDALLPRGWSFPDRAWTLSQQLVSAESSTVNPSSAANLSTCGTTALEEIYNDLGSQLKKHGFSRSEIEEGHSDFAVGDDGELYPRMYNAEPWCMQGEGPVRPIAIRVSDIEDLKTKVLAVVDDVVDALGPSAKVIRQPPEALHTTLFHPDTFYAWRKNETGLANESQTSEQKLPMTNASLEREHSLIRKVTSRHAPLSLEVDSVTTTSGGVMLLLLRAPAERRCEEPSEADALREQFAAEFPNGSCPSHLLHVSLLRLVDLPDEEFESKAEAVQQVCDEATAKLAGYRFNVTRLLFVHEMQVLTLQGNWYHFPLLGEA